MEEFDKIHYQGKTIHLKHLMHRADITTFSLRYHLTDELKQLSNSATAMSRTGHTRENVCDSTILTHYPGSGMASS